MQSFLFIAAGGAIGAILRFLVSGLAVKLTGVPMPWGTILVNLIGCLLIGIMWAVFNAFDLGSNARLFVFTGLLGAFTTFSTFALENFSFFKNGEIYLLITNVLVSNIAGIALVFTGFYFSTYVLENLNK